MSDVFIMGAGCSVPYGFPTGAMLMQKLKDFNYGDHNLDSQSFSPSPYLFDLYQELFGKYQDYTKLRKEIFFRGGNIEVEISNKISKTIVPFAKSIRHSMMVSTDEFLKNRLNQEKSEEADFGKRLIAREIFVAERESGKHFSYEDGKRLSKKYWLGNIDWIQHLLSRIDQQSNWEEILKQTVFLTFNYDRVLENCGAVENGMYQEITKGMETVWEKRLNREDAEKVKYQEFLKNAQRVYFMGFSYIPDNLESIGIDPRAEIIRNANVYATAMGLSSQNRLRISTYLDLKDFEKRNEPEPMPEMEIQRALYENRILKDASAVDLILDYYTIP